MIGLVLSSILAIQQALSMVIRQAAEGTFNSDVDVYLSS